MECFKEARKFLFHFNQMDKDVIWDIFRYGTYTEVWKYMVSVRSSVVWGF